MSAEQKHKHISLKKNKAIKLDLPKFLCDENAVGDHLNFHEMTKLLNVYGFLCVVGRPGSGKTSFTVALICQKKPQIYRKTHHHVIVFMPAGSIKSMKKNPFKKLPDENIFNELNDTTITNVFNRIEGYSANDEKTLLYIDDMTADLKKSNLIIETMKKMIFNRRHLKLNIIITVQSYVNIPFDIRKNIQNLILFKPAKKEFELIFSELLETKKDMALEIMRMTYKHDNHNFLFLNVPSQRIFKNFDEFNIKDNSDSSDSENSDNSDSDTN